MANLRIIGTNAVDSSTLLTSTTEVGTLPITNVKTDIKSEVWRSTTTTEAITLNWSVAQMVHGVALPFCNLTATATIRVRGYTNVADGSPVFDTGVVLACPGSTRDWAASGYAYGGGSYAAAWFTGASVKKLVIDLVDSANSSGYIEVGKLVVGNYFSPSNNTPYGAIKLSTTDDSSTERSEAGDLRVDRSFMFKTITFDLSVMPTTDRDSLWRIFRANGSYKPVFVSLSPSVADVEEEQEFSIYGRLSKAGEIQYQYMNQFASSISVEEV